MEFLYENIMWNVLRKNTVSVPLDIIWIIVSHILKCDNIYNLFCVISYVDCRGVTLYILDFSGFIAIFSK